MNDETQTPTDEVQPGDVVATPEGEVLVVTEKLGEDQFAAESVREDTGYAEPKAEEAPAEDKNILRADVYTKLWVVLTQDEIASTTLAAAQLLQEIHKEEEEFAEQRKIFQQKIKKMKAELNHLTKVGVAGKDHLKVEAVQTFDLKAKETWYTYRDGEYERRRMTPDEWERCTQRPLFEDGPDLPNRVRKVDAGTVTLEVIDGGKATPPADEEKPKGKRGRKPKTVKEVLREHEEAEVKAEAPAEAPAPVDPATVTEQPSEDDAKAREIRDVMREEKSTRGKKDHTL